MGITAIVGAVSYLAIRPLVLGHWDRWQEERVRVRERERRQALRDEAAVSALRQLAQREEATRGAGRRAA